MNQRDCHQLRRRAFSHPWDLDADLTQICQNQPEWAFLRNPAGQLPYIYLSQYIQAVCSRWFGRSEQDWKILDWGCGKGQVSYLLGKSSAQLVSADVDSQSARLLLGDRVLPLVHPYLLPFEDGQFEVVLSVGVLEHVPQELLSLQEIRRVLRPGGLFFCFNLPYISSWIMWAARAMGNWYHDRLYARGKTRRMLQDSGFQVLDMWQRQLLPKNSWPLPDFRFWENVDQWLVEHTPLARLATSLEFLATR